MEAAVWICIDIFPTRSHSSPLLPLRFLRSCRAFFRLDVCVYMRNQCTQIIVSFFGFFFSSFNSTLYCIYHTVLCAMSGERIFSHKLNHLRIINKLEYLPFCHFSINCVLNSLILPLSLSSVLLDSHFFSSSVDVSRFITYMPDCRLLFCIQISRCCSLIYSLFRLHRIN